MGVLTSKTWNMKTIYLFIERVQKVTQLFTNNHVEGCLTLKLFYPPAWIFPNPNRYLPAFP